MMRIKKLCIFATLLVSSSVIELVSAQDFQRPSRGNSFEITGDDGGTRKRGGPESFIERADIDEDGMLDITEFTDSRLANLEERFARRDTDDDGVLSAEESAGKHRDADVDLDLVLLNECIVAAGGDAIQEVDRFADADLDGDGVLSFEEYSLSVEIKVFDEFARIDADIDGLITLEELEASSAAKREQRAIVKDCIEQSTEL